MARRYDRPGPRAGGGEAVLNEMITECLAARARMLSRSLTQIYDEELRSLGLKIGQMTILAAAAREGVLQPGSFARQWHMDTSTLSRNLERMRERGWLTTVAEADARERPVRLTAKGWRLLRRAAPAWERAQDRAAETLTRRGMKMLRDVTQLLQREHVAR